MGLRRIESSSSVKPYHEKAWIIKRPAVRFFYEMMSKDRMLPFSHIDNKVKHREGLTRRLFERIFFNVQLRKREQKYRKC